MVSIFAILIAAVIGLAVVGACVYALVLLFGSKSNSGTNDGGDGGDGDGD